MKCLTIGRNGPAIARRTAPAELRLEMARVARESGRTTSGEPEHGSTNTWPMMSKAVEILRQLVALPQYLQIGWVIWLLVGVPLIWVTAKHWPKEPKDKSQTSDAVAVQNIGTSVSGRDTYNVAGNLIVTTDAKDRQDTNADPPAKAQAHDPPYFHATLISTKLDQGDGYLFQIQNTDHWLENIRITCRYGNSQIQQELKPAELRDVAPKGKLSIPLGPIVGQSRPVRSITVKVYYAAKLGGQQGHYVARFRFLLTNGAADTSVDPESSNFKTGTFEQEAAADNAAMLDMFNNDVGTVVLAVDANRYPTADRPYLLIGNAQRRIFFSQDRHIVFEFHGIPTGISYSVAFVPKALRLAVKRPEPTTLSADSKPDFHVISAAWNKNEGSLGVDGVRIATPGWIDPPTPATSPD
jgi:hypothetical protein